MKYLRRYLSALKGLGACGESLNWILETVNRVESADRFEANAEWLWDRVNNPYWLRVASRAVGRSVRELNKADDAFCKYLQTYSNLTLQDMCNDALNQVLCDLHRDFYPHPPTLKQLEAAAAKKLKRQAEAKNKKKRSRA